MSRGRYDEAKLTAYTLGELDAEARAEVERWIAEDPALCEQVAQIRSVSAFLGEKLTDVPEEHLRPDQRKHLESRAFGIMERHRRRRLVWAPVWLAAASVVLVLTVLIVVLPQMGDGTGGRGLGNLGGNVPTTAPSTQPDRTRGDSQGGTSGTNDGLSPQQDREPDTQN